MLLATRTGTLHYQVRTVSRTVSRTTIDQIRTAIQRQTFYNSYQVRTALHKYLLQVSLMNLLVSQKCHHDHTPSLTTHGNFGVDLCTWKQQVHHHHGDICLGDISIQTHFSSNSPLHFLWLWEEVVAVFPVAG